MFISYGGKPMGTREKFCRQHRIIFVADVSCVWRGMKAVPILARKNCGCSGGGGSADHHNPHLLHAGFCRNQIPYGAYFYLLDESQTQGLHVPEKSHRGICCSRCRSQCRNHRYHQCTCLYGCCRYIYPWCGSTCRELGWDQYRNKECHWEKTEKTFRKSKSMPEDQDRNKDQIPVWHDGNDAEKRLWIRPFLKKIIEKMGWLGKTSPWNSWADEMVVKKEILQK